MPSVFTIEGTDAVPTKTKKPRARKSRTKHVNSATIGAHVGDCKTVKNPRTGCSMQLCYIGKHARTKNGKKSRTGWEFQSSSCPRR